MTNDLAPALANNTKPRARRSKRFPLPPLLARAKHACRLLDVSLATFQRLDAAGKIPAGRRLSGCKVWSVAELKRWIAAGCPERTDWEAILRVTK
jgi:prophage regulatory protein